MKKQINDLLLKMQTGEKCIGETANHLFDLFGVGSSLRVSNEEIIEQTYKSLNKIDQLTELNRQGYFQGYKNGCYWMRKKYDK